MSDACTAYYEENVCFPLSESMIDYNIITEKSNSDKYLLNAPKTSTFTACTKMSIFLATFCEGINQMGLPHEVTNNIYSHCIDLIKNMTSFNKSVVIDENNLEPSQAIDMCADFVCGKFTDYSTRYKRDKAYEKIPTFVPPEEMMLGLRWSMVRLKEAHTAVPRLVPCTFQYVSIIETIKSLFNREDFRNEFSRPKHQCMEGVYEDFCCGSTFQRNPLFMSTENCLQIQIATDDFEVANPLGSKATLHKICAVYFIIRNMPLKFRSKVDNIYLIMLCNTDDTKTKYTDFNDLWRVVLHEISQLENGIQINGLQIKGTVTNLTYDNLGANTCLGFVENFSTSSHVCRFCMCDQVQRKTLCIEVPELMRTMENYRLHLEIIDDSTKVDYKQTKGIKRYCILNNLNYFNIFDNPSVDIMHDLNEGVFLFLMKHLFKYLIAAKVTTEEKLVRAVQYYDYGYLNKSNVPSALNLEKGNLNQNASQSKCLLLNLPFTFIAEKKNRKLEDVWICVTSLLKISQIVYSTRVEEADIVSLEDAIKIHLSSMQTTFGIDLTAKHHFLTHYPNVFRKMGPLKPMSSMRFESKHQVCKGFANDANNFININKTVATRHQQYMSGVQNSYVDQISCGKSKQIDINTEENLSKYLPTQFPSLTKIFELDYFKLNSFEYRKGLLVLKSGSLYEIVHALRVEAKYFFLGKKFDSMGIDTFTNSIKVKTANPSVLKLIDFDELESRTVFEKIHCNNDFYIIADTLELKSLF